MLKDLESMSLWITARTYCQFRSEFDENKYMFIQKTLKTVCDRYTIGITCFYSVENLWTI